MKAYREISDFCRKWILDVFLLNDGGNRISVRDIIVRELVVNTLVNYDMSPASVIRDFGYPCCVTFYAWREECLANVCYMHGMAHKIQLIERSEHDGAACER